MIIAFDLRPLTSGTISGVETYIIHLLKYLIKIDQKNEYVLYINSFKDQSKVLKLFNGPNVITLQTRIPNKLLNLSLAKLRFPKLDRIILKKTGLQPDIYFVPDLRPTPLSKKTKKITTIHDLAFKHFPNFYSFKSRLWYKYINPEKEISESIKIVAVSNYTKKDIIKTYHTNPSKIDVTHEGIDEDFCTDITADKLKQVRNKYHLPDRFFLFLATLEPRKNINLLIEAFQQFKNNNRNYKLVIAGKCNKKLFRKLHLPLYPDIIFTGFVDDKDKASLYTLSEAFIYPSLFEGFGLPLLEAMKCHVPIITSNTSSIPEIVKGSTILIDPNNKDELALAMEKILDPKLRGHLIKKMNNRIKHFTWNECAIKTLKTIKSTFHASHNPLQRLPQWLQSVWKGSNR
jgi:glycosyltransferase involved in cell wall biosynthesis